MGELTIEDYRRGLIALHQSLRQLEERGLDPVTQAQDTAAGLVRRCVQWVASLIQLVGPVHAQAQMATLRGLLELAVGLTLLADNPGRDDRYRAWEESERLHYAEGLIRPTLREELQEVARAFVAHERDRIQTERTRFWPRRRPSRWWGRTLDEDVTATHHPVLRAIYDEHYRVACWMIHGTGLMGVRDGRAQDFLPALEGVCVIAGAQLALICVDQLGRFFPDLGQLDLRTSWLLAIHAPNG